MCKETETCDLYSITKEVKINPNSHDPNGPCNSDFLPKSTVWKGVRRCNFTNSTSARWLGSASTLIIHVNSMYLWYDIMNMALYLCYISPKNHNSLGFPGGAVVESLPANAGDTGSSPGLGGSHPHAAEQLGPWATTTEPARLEPVLCNKRGHNSKRPAHRDEEWPPLATTRESPRTETKTQHSHKLIN